jgi:hypothetical protein
MKRVLKFPLEVADGAQRVMMPAGAKVVHVGNQYERPTMWAEADMSESPALDGPAEAVDASVNTRMFFVIGTGQTILYPNAEYLGTVITRGGDLVWHVYELPYAGA